MPIYVTSLSSPPLYNERSLVELQIVYHKSITLSHSFTNYCYYETLSCRMGFWVSSHPWILSIHCWSDLSTVDRDFHVEQLVECQDHEQGVITHRYMLLIRRSERQSAVVIIKECNYVTLEELDAVHAFCENNRFFIRGFDNNNRNRRN